MASELQILIAGEPLDLATNEDQEFRYSHVVHDLRDLETRNADFSTSIILPLTANNTRLLGSLVPSLARFVDTPLTNIEVEVLAFGVPLIPDAFLVVTDEDAIGRTVTINILGGNAKFFNQLKEDALHALDLDSYDFEWTLADILAKDLTATTEGVVVPQCIWYNNESRRLYDSKSGDDAETFLQQQELGESGFFFYIKTMLEEIFSGLNNLTVDFSRVDDFILNKAFSVPVPIVHDSFGAVDGSYSEVQNLGQNIDDTVPQLQVLPYPTIVENPLGYWNAGNNRYEFIASGFFIVTVHIRGEFNGNNQQFSCLLNNGSIGSLFFPNTETGVSEPFEGEIVTTANVVAGDFIVMNYSGAGTITAQVDFSSFSIEEQGTGRGRSFNVADMMPDLSQKNFVKEVFKLMNIITTEANNVVTLHQFDEIRTEPPILDVRLDISKEVNLANDLLTYGKKNIMKYADNQRVERLDTEGDFQVVSTIIADQVIKINSSFFATDLAQIDVLTDLGIVSIPNYDMTYQLVNDNKMSGANASLNYTTIDRNDLVAGDLIAVNGLRRRVVVVVDNTSGEVDVAWPAVFNDFDWSFWRYSKHDGELHIAEMSGDVLLPNLLLNSNLTPGSKPPNNWNPFWNNLPTVQYIADVVYPGGFLLDMTVAVADRDIIRQEINLQLGFYTAFVEYFDYVTASNRNARITAGTATINVTRDFRTGAQIGTESIDKDFCVFEVTAPGLVRMDIGCGQTGNGTAQMKMGRPMITPGIHDISIGYNPTNGVLAANNFTIRDGGLSQLYTTTKIAVFPESLYWNNLKEQFYSLIVDSVESPFLIVAFANISVVKFVAINGLQPIYIEEYNSYFYINKLEQWNLANSVRLELIELKL